MKLKQGTVNADTKGKKTTVVMVQLLTPLDYLFTIWTNVSQTKDLLHKNRRGGTISDRENMAVYLCLGLLAHC